MSAAMNRDLCRTVEMARFLVFMCSLLTCAGHAAGGDNPNPSIYNSYNNYQQQQWQQQPQHFPFPQSDHYQQQQQYQPQKAVEPAEPEELKSPIQEVPPLPPGWSEHIDPSSGQPYYYNMVDGTTTWDRPSAIVNNTVVDSEDASRYQEHHVDSAPTPASSQSDFSKPVEGMDTNSAEGIAPVERAPDSSIDQRYSTESMPVPENDGHISAKDANALTAVTRDEQKIREEESWRVSHGWNNADGPSGQEYSSPENVLPPESRQQNQGWGLPSPQSDGWGLSKTPKTDSVPPVENRDLGDKTDQFRQADRNPFPQQQQQQQQQQQLPQPQHSQHHTSQQYAQSQGQKPPGVVEQGANFDQPITDQGPKPMPQGSFGSQQEFSSEKRPVATQSGQHLPPIQGIPSNQQNNPTYQQQQHSQQPQQLDQHPPRSYGQHPIPSDTSRLPHQQVPPYYQAQQHHLNPTGHLQQSQQGGNVYGQRPPNQYGPQYGQPQNQYPGAPIYGQPPQKQGSQTSYASQSGQGQLIPQDQQNLVKESLGRTWQSILGLRDRTKEVVESATSTVAQSAREATQTITEKGTGWWGQAKSVLGSVFEAEPPSEYSLSGIYGNAPPPSNQGPAGGYPPQSQYPPRYPPQQQYPPRGQGQQPLHPAQARYPPGYSPPQPRVDTPYPYQQQGPRQEMPPVQRQYGPGTPQSGGVPPQRQPFDPNRPPAGYYQQQMPPSQQQQQQQHPPRKPDDRTNPWSHPGLGSEY